MADEEGQDEGKEVLEGRNNPGESGRVGQPGRTRSIDFQEGRAFIGEPLTVHLPSLLRGHLKAAPENASFRIR